MKKTVSTLTLLAMLMVIVLTSAPAASAEIPNVVLSGPASEQEFNEMSSSADTWYSVNGYPSWDDIVAIGDGDRITGPSASRYLAEYQARYVKATKGNRIYVYKTAERMTQNPATVEHGARVYVLATKGTASLIIYRDRDNKPTSGWVSTNLLSDEYPGTVVSVGTRNDIAVIDIGDPGVSWSGKKMAGTDCEYLLIDEPIEDCTGFTLEYRAQGKGTEDCSGSRDVYINNGEGWVYIGGFQYKSSKAFHVTVKLETPMPVYAVATPLVAEKGMDCEVRELVLNAQVLGTPCRRLLESIDAAIEYPEENEYYQNFKYGYVHNLTEQGAYGYQSAGYKVPLHSVREEEAVEVLAERQGYSCVIVLSTNEAIWIDSKEIIIIESEYGQLSDLRYLGDMFLYGQDVQIDENKALELYQLAGERGLSYSFSRIGDTYYYGEILHKNVSRDFDLAKKYYLKAAEMGDTHSMYQLGMMCENGEGFDQDYKAAMEWYMKGIDNPNMMYRIGLLYRDGKGVEQDYAKALEYFEKGAAWGKSPQADYYLGMMYEEGTGVEKDLEKALEWYQAAADMNFYSAKEKVKELTGK